MSRRYRPRKLFKFWLYHDLAEDSRLMEYIDYLRQTRQFAKVLRSGLRLMWTLGQGDLSVLFELFPTLRSQFVPDNTLLIEDIRQMLQAQLLAAPESGQSSGLKPLAATKSLPMPTFEDDDQGTLLIRRDTSADNQSTANFLHSMSALQ